MNYLIWKNINSKDIKGLLISELPPITKPKMRVQETQIDGVDGSIIEELGYESYDKKIFIGLSRDFDIDEVIEYFSGEDKVVFSNEPDKYYNAKIIEQIDYERLLRFKTATVTFRVQPFKYEYQEESDFLLKNISGNEIKINDVELLNISIEGNSTQEGTPTPETPIEIQNIGSYNQSTNKYEIDINITNETKTSTIKLELDEPLRSLPNGTKDIAKIEKNRLSIYTFIKSIILNGTEDWSITNIDKNSALFYLDLTIPPKSGASCMSSHFVKTNNYSVNSPIGIQIATNQRLFIRASFLTIDDFKTWLSSNNTEVLYELEYPEAMEIEDRTGKYTMPEGNVTITNSENKEMVVTYTDDKMMVVNKGNYISKPIITIKGTGYIEFILNGNKLFSYTFPDGENEVVIDSQKQDAYLGVVLKNRNMSGEFPILKKGENIITWSADIENIEISQKSRWI